MKMFFLRGGGLSTMQYRRKLIYPSISTLPVQTIQRFKRTLNQPISTPNENIISPSNLYCNSKKRLLVSQSILAPPPRVPVVKSLRIKRNNIIEEDDDEIQTRVPVKSMYAARTIDINAILPTIFNGSKEVLINGKDVTILPSPVKHRFGKVSVMLQFPPCKEENGNDIERYVIVFRFGSVVFINMKPMHADAILKEITAFSQDLGTPISVQKEYFEIAIKPSTQLPTVTPDYVTVSHIDMNAVSVVSTIMAQTVAFDSYNVTVDELLANFAAINATVEKTGNFTEMEKENLFKVVAQNNSLFIDMVSKIGVLDRSDTAWNSSQYEAIYQGMREEFELDGRFAHVEFKLNMIQQNTKFFLEILHNQKSQTLEYVIIVLIAFECVLMSLDMSGLGRVVFETVLDLLKK